MNIDREDRKNDSVGLEIERFREKEIDTGRLRESAGENEIAAYR